MPPFYTQLPNRGEIRLSGDDSAQFLQGLITNDINTLSAGQLLYACLLTPQGKFLHDFFIRLEDNSYIIDCEGGERAQDLYNCLVRYRFRAKIDINLKLDSPVWGIIGDTPSEHAYTDPRHTELGTRHYSAPQKNIEQRSFESENGWDERRIKLGIADGSRDLIPEKSTLAEGNIDQYNGISYKKGCYVGQELTARMHYRNLGKKQLIPIPISEITPDMDVRSQAGSFAMVMTLKTS